MLKPGCYECKYRGEVPGDAHSCCRHPQSGLEGNPLVAMFALMASARKQPIPFIEHAAKLGIKANANGIQRGWFNWPFNFDPVWLEACEGFTQKGETK